METIIVHPANKEQLIALKAFIKALGMDFETKIVAEFPEVTSKDIDEAYQEMREGKGVKIALKDLWS